MTRQYELPECPVCKTNLGTPYYTSSWSTAQSDSICLKCIFNQKNKTQTLITALKKEEEGLHTYYTCKILIVIT